MNRLLSTLLLLLLISCNSSDKDSEKDSLSQQGSSEALFLELWESFEENYAFFELRKVDWASEKIKGLELVKNTQVDSSLFSQFCEILKKFGDAHINLESSDLDSYCNAAPMPDFYKEFPNNESFSHFLVSRDKSLEKLGIEEISNAESGLFQYGIDKKREWAYF